MCDVVDDGVSGGEGSGMLCGDVVYDVVLCVMVSRSRVVVKVVVCCV